MSITGPFVLCFLVCFFLMSMAHFLYLMHMMHYLVVFVIGFPCSVANTFLSSYVCDSDAYVVLKIRLYSQ